MTVKISEEEFNEIERIKKKYKVSYNKIIRSGLQFYVAILIGKEEFRKSGFLKAMKPLIGDIKNYTKSLKFSKKIERVIFHLSEKERSKLDLTSKSFEKRIHAFKKRRKRGRPKTKKRDS